MRQGVIASVCWLALALAACACAPVARAQSTEAAIDTDAPRHVPALTGFRRLGPAQGLSQASVRAMVQDRHSFLWFGTQDGLNRFDGNEFRAYRHRKDDPDSLPGDLIRALAIDRDGVLWIGGTGGLSRYLEARDRFEAVPIEGATGDPQPEVHALHVDATGALWVATYEGLSRVDPQTRRRTSWRR